MRSIDQVAVVVRDLDEAMRRYFEQLGIGPWEVYTFSPDWVRDMTFRGRAQPHSMRLAFAQVGALQYELIEPLEGPSTYKEFLEAHGEGLHHLGYVVDDIDAEVAAMEAQGFAVLQSGRNDDGGYAYFETGEALGCLVEAIELPRTLRPPERIFPA